MEEIEAWFKEVEAIYSEFQIVDQDCWNIDKSPFQIRFLKGTLKVLSVRNKAGTKRVIFNPNNRESITAIDAISATRAVIPSMLIFSRKVLLQGNIEQAVTIDKDMILTTSKNGYNTIDRVLQWLQHFNTHSFRLSSSFEGTVEDWFGYPTRIHPRELPEFERDPNKPSFVISTKPRAYHVLFLDGYEAYNDLDFMLYC